jgi:hypothetical protein
MRGGHRAGGALTSRAQVNVFATTGMDRSLVLYDLRSQTPVRKLIQTMKTNALCWNPMEPYMFVTVRPPRAASRRARTYR